MSPVYVTLEFSSSVTADRFTQWAEGKRLKVIPQDKIASFLLECEQCRADNPLTWRSIHPDPERRKTDELKHFMETGHTAFTREDRLPR